jgi:hypothetical protein
MHPAPIKEDNSRKGVAEERLLPPSALPAARNVDSCRNKREAAVQLGPEHDAQEHE